MPSYSPTFDKDDNYRINCLIRHLITLGCRVLFSGQPTGYVYFDGPRGSLRRVAGQRKVFELTSKSLAMFRSIPDGDKEKELTRFIEDSKMGMGLTKPSITTIVFYTKGFNKTMVPVDNQDNDPTHTVYTARYETYCITEYPDVKEIINIDSSIIEEVTITGIEDVPSDFINEMLDNMEDLESVDEYKYRGIDFDPDVLEELIPENVTVKEPTPERDLEKENQMLRDTLEDLIDMYIANRGTKHEFIKCITPKSCSEMTALQRITDKYWTLWDRARILVGEK